MNDSPFIPPPGPVPDGFRHVAGVRYGYIWWPPVELEETTENYVFSADLEGIDPRAVEIDLLGEELTVSGKDGGTPFAFTITLARPVAADDVGATFENGVLELTVPKLEGARRRKIELSR